MRIRTLLWLVAIPWVGCGGAEPFTVQVVFPDEVSLQATRRLVLVAIVPGEEAGCPALLNGSASPGDEGYAVEAQTTLTFPFPGSATLKLTAEGNKLFYAEAYDEAEQILLRGCSVVLAGPNAPHEATITLQE